MRLRLYRFVAPTRAEGPGVRAALWVQGCTLGCRGCFNPHLWPADNPAARDVEVADLVARTVGTAGIEGVTLLGGEPFEQAPALAGYAAAVRAAGLTVMCFTGYRYEDLAGGALPGGTDLLAAVDLLVDGPYDATRPDRVRPWIGSTNQRLLALTPRYEYLDQQPPPADRIEVRPQADGSLFVNGMADRAALRLLRRCLDGSAPLEVAEPGQVQRVAADAPVEGPLAAG